MEKVCTKCYFSKPIELFSKDKYSSNGKKSSCKECDRRRSALYKQNNKHKCEKYSKEYRIKNKEVIKTRAINSYYKNQKRYLHNKKIYDELNRKKINIYVKTRRKNDLLFKLSSQLRTRLYRALSAKSWKQNTHFSEYIGCTLEQLKQYIQSQFTGGMTWDNYSIKGWTIDHIIPLSLAKTEEQMIQLCHYSNLQPMWHSDNRQKSNKMMVII